MTGGIYGGMNVHAVKTIWDGLDWSVIADMLAAVLPSLICITLHELSHGYTAYRLGDNTAKNMGRLTLNPLKHIDVMGLIMMIVFKFGWAKPVPVDMRNFKDPKKGMAITALAGPVSNVVISVVFLFIYGLVYYPLSMHDGVVSELILKTVATTSYLSLAYAVFNIIPIPPLDGSKVLFAFLSEESYWKLMRYEKYGMILLFALVAGKVLGQPLAEITGLLYDRLFVIAEFSFDIMRKLLG